MQAVTGEPEIANDFGPQKAHDVREHRKGESRKDLFAHRGAAHALAALKHEHFAARAREVRSVDQRVVAAAHDHCVVTGCHQVRFRSPLHGLCITRASVRD